MCRLIGGGHRASLRPRFAINVVADARDLVDLRGNENDASRIFLKHVGQVGARQTYALHDIHLEIARRLGIINFKERFCALDAKIVYQNVAAWFGCRQHCAAVGGAQISGDASH